MQDTTTVDNCVQHPWQPALGVCSLCAEHVCVRCSMQRDDEVYCEACARDLPQPTERLPFEQEGAPWLASVHETSRRLLRRPGHTFSHLADGRIDPAWRFAWACGILTSVVAGLTARSWGRVAVSPLLGALIATFTVFAHGTLYYLAARAFGGRARWSLWCRASGYASVWAVLFRLLLLPCELAPSLGPLLWAGSGLVLVMTTYAMISLGRGRAQMSTARATLAALLVATLIAGAWLLMLQRAGRL